MPIPISELLAYCEFFGIKELWERESFFRRIRVMDAAYVETVGERIKRETDKNAGS
jgi:hypothetical protein